MRKAFTLMELLIATMVIAIVMVSFVDAILPQIEHNRKEETLKTFEKLSKALDFHYEAVLSYRRNNPDWVTKADCSVERSWIIPPGIKPDGCWSPNPYFDEVLVLWKDNSDPSKSRILAEFREAGCKLANSGTGYDVKCYDGWGNPFHYVRSNTGGAHSAPYSAEAGSPMRITVISAGRDGTFGTSDDLSFTWSSATLDEKYRKRTFDRLSAIASALDVYFRQRFSIEVTERTYPSGLSQEDDMKVDWYLQLCTDEPQTTCQDSTCSNLRAVWPSVTCDGNQMRNTCDIETILSHLNLDSSYKVDAFGNPVYVNLCFDPDGDGYPNGAAPNTPATDGGAFSASVSNGFITVMSTGE